MEQLPIVLFWSLIGSVVSLAGALILLKSTKRRGAFARWALPFGAGALLVAAFLSLLPEALHHDTSETVPYWVLGGFLTFFVLERTVHWFHHHHGHGDTSEGRDVAQRSLVILGDTLHNAIDGVAIGAAFLIDIPTGIVTSMAVAAHEIPQEIGDFGFLLSRGMSTRRTILVNLMSSLATVVGAIGIYLMGTRFEIPLAPILALTAGFFIYIAASDIIPDIHERPHAEANKQAAILLLGAVLATAMVLLISHE